MNVVEPVLLELNLQPGELYLARKAMLLRTILGSCVGATIWCPRLGAGALCHGVLPLSPSTWPPGTTLADAHRYVDFSIRYLVRKFDALGASRQELKVNLFGGADVLQIDARPGKTSVGAQNCQAALRVVQEVGLTVSGSDLGGARGRRVHFHTGTGEVLLQRFAGWKGKTP